MATNKRVLSRIGFYLGLAVFLIITLFPFFVMLMTSFKSAKEARRYDELALMERRGLIRNLQIERAFTLQEPYIQSDGAHVKSERYFADFVYERPTKPDCNGQVYWIQEVEDVKGKRTQMYLRKKNEMLAKYGITIREV